MHSHSIIYYIITTHHIWSDTRSIIKNIAKKEAVHPLQSFNNLCNRFGPSRRCYAFFHPSMPNDEPLIFVHITLLKDQMAHSMDYVIVLDNAMTSYTTTTTTTTTTTAPNMAIFYSITSTHHGLSGVDLWNLLIKRVVETLSKEFPNIQTFSMLSPIPRFHPPPTLDIWTSPASMHSSMDSTGITTSSSLTIVRTNWKSRWSWNNQTIGKACMVVGEYGNGEIKVWNED